jgi:hypothetical protein
MQLVLPGQSLDTPAAAEQMPENVSATLGGFQPVHTRHDGNQQRKPTVHPEDLMLLEYMLVRRDGLKGPLDKPYLQGVATLSTVF